ncbi:MAG: FkbM family methyltransferase [Chitinophagaceae bacterium]|nr:FkbM family methyltransferase [Chitinophagaceae bacterium]
MARFSPLPLSKNEYYDRRTEKIIIRTCSEKAVCVDVGAHDGKILSLFIRRCPLATHFAFEPLPHLFRLLVRKYGSACQVFKLALSNKTGMASFNYVVSNAAYSSLLRRPDVQHEAEAFIEVKMDLLDRIIPPNIPIALIKIDVEGGELDVLRGAERIIENYKPYILFEFGQGGSDAFGVTSKMMHTFFQEAGYEISLLKSFLSNKPPLDLDALTRHYHKGDEYFFIAYPTNRVATDIIIMQ